MNKKLERKQFIHGEKQEVLIRRHFSLLYRKQPSSCWGFCHTILQNANMAGHWNLQCEDNHLAERKQFWKLQKTPILASYKLSQRVFSSDGFQLLKIPNGTRTDKKFLHLWQIKCPIILLFAWTIRHKRYWKLKFQHLESCELQINCNTHNYFVIIKI